MLGNSEPAVWHGKKQDKGVGWSGGGMHREKLSPEFQANVRQVEFRQVKLQLE